MQAVLSGPQTQADTPAPSLKAEGKSRLTRAQLPPSLPPPSRRSTPSLEPPHLHLYPAVTRQYRAPLPEPQVLPPSPKLLRSEPTTRLRAPTTPRQSSPFELISLPFQALKLGVTSSEFSDQGRQTKERGDQLGVPSLLRNKTVSPSTVVVFPSTTTRLTQINSPNSFAHNHYASFSTYHPQLSPRARTRARSQESSYHGLVDEEPSGTVLRRSQRWDSRRCFAFSHQRRALPTPRARRVRIDRLGRCSRRTRNLDGGAGVSAWKQINDAVHEEGGLIFCQLWHLGRVSHPDQMQQKVFGQPVRAASEVGCRGGKLRELPGKPGFVPAPPMEDPKVVVEAFRLGAINAKKAGFDGVEFHCANGYLPAQFLDNYSNRRTDNYGGSYQNRARFAVECLEAILTVWPADRVGIKLSPTGSYKDVGMNEEDTIETYGYLLSEISRLSLSYIQVVRHFEFGDPLCDHKKDGPGPEEEGARRALGPKLDMEEKLVQPFVELQKGKERATKVFWIGGFGGQEVGAEREGTEWVESGRADGIVFGRDSITNPSLPFRLFYNVPLTNIDGGDPKRWYVDGDRGKGDGYNEMLSEEFVRAQGEGKVLVQVGA